MASREAIVRKTWRLRVRKKPVFSSLLIAIDRREFAGLSAKPEGRSYVPLEWGRAGATAELK